MTGPMQFAVRVAAITAMAPGVRRLTLERLDGEALPPCSAGSHTVLTLATQAGARKNAYSLLGASLRGGRWSIAVKRNPASRGGSAFIHDALQPGAALVASVPANLFAIDRTARRHILIAGGIGVTPIDAMAHELAGLGADFTLHYVTRQPGDLFAAELLAAWGGRCRIHTTAGGKRPDLAALTLDQPLGTHLYVCGPDGMTDALLAAARANGWPASALHVERFAAPASGTPFRAHLARTGVTVSVGADETLLEAIEAAGVAAPCLCRGGACGQCEVAVLGCDSALDHRDHYLSAAARQRGDRIMLCMSRADGGDLVLDL